LPRSGREEVLSSSRTYYARRAGYYDLLAQRKGRDRETLRELEFLEFGFRTHATRRVRDVLDIACGGGRHLVGLAQRGYRCTGHDFTPERIEAAKARAARTGVSVTLGVGDAAKVDYDDAFDAVLRLYILFLLPDDDAVQRCLRGVRRSLRRGGVLVCNIYNPFTLGKTWVVNAMRNRYSVEEQRASGIRITEVQRTHDYDPVRGVVWVDETTVIEADDGRHVFRDKERARLLTCWDIEHHLKSAGFGEIECYPDWEVRQVKKPKAEQLVFVVRR
jgi:SAM-dependent methyltransferase